MMNAPAITPALLTVSPWNRPGTKLKGVKKVVQHWTALPDHSGRDVWNLRNFLENLANTHFEQASAHNGVGSDGTILQIVPWDEVAWGAGWYRWSDAALALGDNPHEWMLNTEVCPIDEKGNYSPEAEAAAAYLAAYQLRTFGLGIDDLWRHYDCCGDDGFHGRKLCPLLYAGPPGSDADNRWQAFKAQVKAMMG